MPKKLISFLGNTNYTRCNYYLPKTKTERVEAVRFVQEAIIQLYCKDWTVADRYLVFTTTDAHDKNWVDEGHLDRYKQKVLDKDFGTPLIGLENRLKEVGVGAQTRRIEIPVGFSTDEVWIIFQKVFEQIEDGDELLFDITNAFRFIPMLGMVLINYAKVLRNVTKVTIVYGAFEKLGPNYKVSSMPLKERDAPIIDITNFTDLQAWTNAANAFVNFGNSDEIVQLTEQGTGTLIHQHENTEALKNQFDTFAENLNLMTQSITTNRGKQIIQGEVFTNITKAIDELQNYEYNVPLHHLLAKIKERIKDFQYNKIMNGFHAVQWCIDCQLVQQGITLLHEMVLTFIVFHFKEKYPLKNKPLDYTNKYHRDLIGYVLQRAKYPNRYKEWINIAKKYSDVAEAMLLEPIIQDFKDHYVEFTGEVRNLINHGGFKKQDNTEPQIFIEELKTKYKIIYKIALKYSKPI